jgi:formimidoylglutamase
VPPLIPHVAPPVWPTGIRQGRFAATIVQNRPELTEGEGEGASAELKKCRVALLGIPDDTGVELNLGRPGAKGGPAAFRAALARYGVAIPADAGEGMAYPRIFDVGDITLGSDIHETHDRITEATLAILERGLFPIAIGGGHDCTFAFVRGVARAFGPMSGLYVDAHLDVRPEIGSGMPFRALLEGGLATRLTCIGMNPLVNTREHAEYLRAHGGRILKRTECFTAHGTIGWEGDCLRAILAGVPAAQARAFVSLDMDAFDASIAPGVSALNPSGYLAREVEPVIRLAARSTAVKCFDIMELNPQFDVDGRTARLAAHMFLTFLRGFAEREAGIAAEDSE